MRETNASGPATSAELARRDGLRAGERSVADARGLRARGSFGAADDRHEFDAHVLSMGGRSLRLRYRLAASIPGGADGVRRPLVFAVAPRAAAGRMRARVSRFSQLREFRRERDLACGYGRRAPSRPPWLRLPTDRGPFASLRRSSAGPSKLRHASALAGAIPSRLVLRGTQRRRGRQRVASDRSRMLRKGYAR